MLDGFFPGSDYTSRGRQAKLLKWRDEPGIEPFERTVSEIGTRPSNQLRLARQKQATVIHIQCTRVAVAARVLIPPATIRRFQ